MAKESERSSISTKRAWAALRRIEDAIRVIALSDERSKKIEAWAFLEAVAERLEVMARG